MSRTRIYVLKEHVKTRLEGRGLTLKCERCDEAIAVGEAVVSKSSPAGRTKRFFHRSCWNKMFM